MILYPQSTPGKNSRSSSPSIKITRHSLLGRDKMSHSSSCTIIPPSRIVETATVMADAFSDSPAYNYIFQGDMEYRKNALEWIFQKNLHLIHQRCPTAIRGLYDLDCGDIHVCFLWTPSPHQQIRLWDMIRAGFWYFPFRFGFFTVYRLLRVMNDLERGFQKHIAVYSTEGIPFLTLERMAVRSDCRGKGLGTQALTSILDDFVTQSDDSRYVRLMTQEERNVRFYQRLGCKVIGREEMYPENDTYRFTNWYMIYDAKNILPPLQTLE
jgi:ribosomal protein S18 acetylase RimI-like enzyme